MTMRSYTALLALTVALPFFMATGPSQATSREVTSLNANWRFLRGDVADGGAVVLNETGWKSVSLPHTFNVGDASSGGSYYRGPVWYRRSFRQSKGASRRRAFLEFDGAALATDVWLNGIKVGRHEGGFARFRFDLTPFLKVGANSLAVRVDNSRTQNSAPLGGDYTVFGGLYRGVRLIGTNPLHFDMMDYGSSGVYFRSTDVSTQKASLRYVARIANDTDAPVVAKVIVTLRDSKKAAVQKLVEPIVVAAHSVTPATLTGVLDHPHLWQGVSDPYLYTTDVQIISQGGVADEVDTPVGIRDIRLDADRGLLLNGQVYTVHGVNVHQVMRPEKGPAVSDADTDLDYQMLGDMGVTGLRFAHYQHPAHEYDLADRKGFLIWTELPLSSEVDGGPEFSANATQQLRELIRQNINHPSVFVWGLGNEIYKVDDNSSKVLEAMQALAHSEDSSRPTTYANCCGEITGPQASHTDVIGSNVYFGWYSGEFAELGPWLDKNHAQRPKTPEAVSEYGAGASALQEEDTPRRPQPASKWHPEQYQALYHEAAWRQIRDRSYLWASFAWVGFDFPSAGRNEGDRAGFNDKGLITYDRKIKKDAYFWYQANWATRPMVYITSRRLTVRASSSADVKVYCNQPFVSLRLNGVDMGMHPVTDHIATWHVTLQTGRNHIETTANDVHDTVNWVYQPINKASLQ